MKKLRKELMLCGGNICLMVDEFCNKVSPNKIYVCTRSKGHTGDHIACSGNNHDLLSWPQKTKKKKKLKPPVAERSKAPVCKTVKSVVQIHSGGPFWRSLCMIN